MGKNARFHGSFYNVPNFREDSRKEFEKFTGPTAVISRCYVNANQEICRIAHFEISEQ